MFKKTLLLTGISIACVSNFAMAAGLTLMSQDISAPIAVYCGPTTTQQTKGRYDVQPNSQLGPLPWALIAGMFGSNNLDCSFKLDNGSNKTIGTAHMSLTYTTGTITNVKLVKPYTTAANNPSDWGVPHTNLTVKITQTN